MLKVAGLRRLDELRPEDGEALQELMVACDDYARITFGIPTR
jgi:hypothetical protein